MKVSRKKEALRVLHTLLNNVAGATTSWDEIEADLAQLSAHTLRALIYRVDRVLAEAYEDGQNA